MTDGIPYIGKLLIGLGIVMIAIGGVLLPLRQNSIYRKTSRRHHGPEEEFHVLFPLGHKHSAEPASDLPVLALREEVSGA